MIELFDDQMNFDETTHTYTKGGNNYISVTTLLKKYNISPDYGNIPPDILANAAKRGTYVHKCFEEYIKNGVNLDSSVVDPFIVYTTNRGIDLTLAKSEELVYDDRYLIAGTIDFQYTDNGKQVVADFKNTSSIHWDSVTWQLSIYNFILSKGNIFDYVNKDIKVIHVHNGFEVKSLPLIPYDEVEKLLMANLNNQPYTYVPDYSAILQTSEAIIYRNVIEEIEQYTKYLNMLKEKKAELEKTIITNMTNGNHKAITVNGMNINLVTRKASPSWDGKALEQYFQVNAIDPSPFKKISGKDITYVKTTLIATAVEDSNDEA